MTRLLPVVLIPTFAQVVDASAHLWSSSDAADATDFGTPGNPDVLLQVEGPNVAGKLYIYDPTTATHAWIDADALAAVDFAITP